MPTETVIVLAGIVLVFAVFAVTLVWADYYSRDFRSPGVAYVQEPEAKESISAAVWPRPSISAKS